MATLYFLSPSIIVKHKFTLLSKIEGVCGKYTKRDLLARSEFLPSRDADVASSSYASSFATMPEMAVDLTDDSSDSDSILANMPVLDNNDWLLILLIRQSEN